MSQMENNEFKSRRGFIKLSVIAGATASLCGCHFSNRESTHSHSTQVLTQDGRLVEVKHAQITPLSDEELVSGAEARKGIPNRKFVMVIDLAKCSNARKCVKACQVMHHQPEDREWLKVKLMKDHDQAAPYWFPKTCFHCDNPPCVKVCPVNATFKRDDGLVLIDNDRCIGCKFCMAACPYSTRVFNWDEPEQTDEVKMCAPSPETSVPSQIGTVDKCDFCPDMVRRGKLPDCVTACPNGVFYFGDEMEDTVTNGEETVSFKQLIKEKAGYRYMEDLGTKPRVYYLPPRDRYYDAKKGLDNVSDEMREMLEPLFENQTEI